MTPRASSGSNPPINSVEPLMSANNAVTIFRSPTKPQDLCSPAAISPRSGRINAEPITGAAGPSVSAVPHLRQKFASEEFDVSQERHLFSSLLPHFTQNSRIGGILVFA